MTKNFILFWLFLLLIFTNYMWLAIYREQKQAHQVETINQLVLRP